MEAQTGWAEPELILSAPRIQKVDGFNYFYIEQIHPEDGEKEVPIDEMIETARHLYRQFVAAVDPPLLVMFFGVAGQPGKYDIQVGFVVPQDTCAGGEAKVRYIPPALVGSLLAWGDVNSLAKSYGTILEYMDANGYEAVEGWREYYFYWEGESSKNNVTWIQHIAKERENSNDAATAV